MKKNLTTALITAAIIALFALAVPQAHAGDNILASGTVTLTAGSTNATEEIGLYNVDGQEWGEVVGFRLYNGSTNSVNIRVTCEDMDVPIELFVKDTTLTNEPAHLDTLSVWSRPCTNLYAKTLKVQVWLFEQTNAVAAACPYYFYAK